MDLLENIVEDVSVPTIYVEAPGRIVRITPGIVRVGLVTRQRAPEPYHRVEVNLLWDWQMWLSLPELYSGARDHIRKAPPASDTAWAAVSH